MPRPGDRLRCIAARRCSAETMERLIDPLVADLQTEYADAIRHGRVWRSRRVRMAGYIAFVKVMAFTACEASMQTLHDGAADDRQVLRRTIGFSIFDIIVATLGLLVVVFLVEREWTPVGLDSRVRLLVYLIPQVLPLAIPVGLLVGILRGLAGRAVSRRSHVAVLVMALVCSAASFATLAWMIPVAEQAFSRSFVGRDAVKGPQEMTISELRQRIDSYAATPMAGSRMVRALKFSYYQRWALSSATLVIPLFALSLVPRRYAGRLNPFWVVVGICFVYYQLLNFARETGTSGALPVFVAAWLPNVVFMLGAAALLVAAARRAEVTV